MEEHLLYIFISDEIFYWLIFSGIISAVTESISKYNNSLSIVYFSMSWFYKVIFICP